MRHGLEKYISIRLLSLDAVVSFLPIDKFWGIGRNGGDLGCQLGHGTFGLRIRASAASGG